MLAHRLRWPNNNPTLGQRLVFAGFSVKHTSTLTMRVKQPNSGVYTVYDSMALIPLKISLLISKADGKCT